MAHVITAGANIITPSAIVEYESNRKTRTRIHSIINKELPDATLRVASARNGRLTLVFLGATAEADSDVAENILSTASVFTLTSDQSTLSMPFVLPEDGNLTRKPSSSATTWHVSFDWQEVSA